MLNIMTDSQLWGIMLACCMMLLDIASGFLGAIARHDVSSSVMRQGLIHKSFMLIIIAMTYILTCGLSHVSGNNIMIPSIEIVCLLIIAMEIASVIENIGKAWPSFAETKLYRVFKKITEEGDN